MNCNKCKHVKLVPENTFFRCTKHNTDLFTHVLKCESFEEIDTNKKENKKNKDGK